MKYGLLYYKDTDNIGDDIQTYAASRFLPRIDYMIDRENLEGFIPRKKEYVATIMNAWYIHDKFNFNISPYIYPLFISMFFKKFPYTKGITVGTDYINDNVVETLKRYGPIGTRDLHTKKIMDKLGIDNYFSGCMTLTLEKFKEVKKEDYIVAVGLTEDEIAYIKDKTNRPIKVFKQDVKRGSFSNEPWEQRKNRVEKTLKLYQGAHMVITNKLHCLLPCLALETPVVLLYDTSFAENKDRIGTYLNYVNYVDREKFKTSNINFEVPTQNPKEYLKLRNSLIKKCNEFIKETKLKNLDELPDLDFYIKYVQESKNSRKPIIKHLKLLAEKYEKECEKSANMHDEINELKNAYSEIERKYNDIVASKGWKILEKLRKLKK